MRQIDQIITDFDMEFSTYQDFEIIKVEDSNQALEACSRNKSIAIISEDHSYIYDIGKALFVNGFDCYVLDTRTLTLGQALILHSARIQAKLKKGRRDDEFSLPHFFQWVLRHICDTQAQGYQFTKEIKKAMELLVEAYYNGWLQPDARHRFSYNIIHSFHLPRGEYLSIVKAQWLRAVEIFAAERGMTVEEFREKQRENRQRILNHLGKK